MSSIFLSTLLLAQAAPVAAASEVVIPQDVRALPGQLDNFPVLNSNSPELVNSEGILLSTFPKAGKQSPGAHLDYALTGRFDLFAHHVTRLNSSKGNRPLYHGILLHNPASKPVKVLVLQATSYLSSAEAPFVKLADQIVDPGGRVFSGPGSRTTGDVLRRERQSGWSTSVVIPPQESHMLVNLPLPPSNSRTTWMRLWSNGNLYAASLAMHGRSKDYKPTLAEWKGLLAKGDLVKPRDQPPTPLDSNDSKFIYGRVAGISQGVQWQAKVTDKPGSDVLNVPDPGESISYVINSLDRGTLGTKQIQSAPMLVRYEDTAYRAHGNYGIRYNLDLPLHNATKQPQQVTLSMQTPIKEDQLSKQGLRFFKSLTGPVFFRGTIKLSYTDSKGRPQKRYFHLVQRRGQQGKPLITLPIAPGKTELVNVEFLYPPDSTPPQVLTVKTSE